MSDIFEGLTPVGDDTEDIFKGLTPIDDQKQKVDDGFWIDFAKTILRDGVKPALKGLAAIPDAAVFLGNLGVSGVNKAAGTDIPQGKYPSDMIGQGVDYATGGLSEGEAGIVGKGIEFGTSMLGGGLAGKALKEGSKVAPWLGSTKASDVAMASAMGATTKAAEDMGADPLTAAGTGLAVGITPSLAIKGTQKAIQKGAQKHADQHIDDINIEAYDAAKRQDIDLPRNAVDKTPMANVGQIAAEHSILSAKTLKDQKKLTNQSYFDAVERNLDASSTKKTLANQDLRDSLYAESKGKLTDEHVIQPTETLRRFEDAKQAIIDNTLVTNKKENEYLSQLDKLKRAIHDTQVSTILGKDGKSLSLNDFNSLRSDGAIPVKKLVDQKERLNKQINKLSQDEWALKEELINIRNALKPLCVRIVVACS
jgi:hypothetical protein